MKRTVAEQLIPTPEIKIRAKHWLPELSRLIGSTAYASERRRLVSIYSILRWIANRKIVQRSHVAAEVMESQGRYYTFHEFDEAWVMVKTAIGLAAQNHQFTWEEFEEKYSSAKTAIDAGAPL